MILCLSRTGNDQLGPYWTTVKYRPQSIDPVTKFVLTGKQDYVSDGQVCTAYSTPQTTPCSCPAPNPVHQNSGVFELTVGLLTWSHHQLARPRQLGGVYRWYLSWSELRSVRRVLQDHHPFFTVQSQYVIVRSTYSIM